MADFQLNQGDQSVVAVTLTDNNGNVDTADAGSVVATLSPNASGSTATVSSDQTSVTLVAGTQDATGDVLTVTGSVEGVAFTPATQAFDVLSAFPTSGVVSLSFAGETPTGGTVAPASAAAVDPLGGRAPEPTA
jgi:hypothetical protein